MRSKNRKVFKDLLGKTFSKFVGKCKTINPRTSINPNQKKNKGNQIKAHYDQIVEKPTMKLLKASREKDTLCQRIKDKTLQAFFGHKLCISGNNEIYF